MTTPRTHYIEDCRLCLEGDCDGSTWIDARYPGVRAQRRNMVADIVDCMESAPYLVDWMISGRGHRHYPEELFIAERCYWLRTNDMWITGGHFGGFTPTFWQRVRLRLALKRFRRMKP